MISDADCEKCLLYLSTSAKEYSAAEGRRTWAAEALKIERARQFIDSKAKTVAERENEAIVSEGYRTAARELADSEQDYLLIRAYREAAICKVDVFRTQEASKRASNIV